VFQCASLTSKMRDSVLAFQEELQRSVGEIAGELRMAEYNQPASGSTTCTVPALMVEGRPEPIPNSPVRGLDGALTRPNLTPGDGGFQNTQLPSIDSSHSVLRHGTSSGPQGPFDFAKLPNPMYKMFESLSVTDGLHLDSFITFFRVFVRIRYMAPAFRISTGHLLQIFYGYTKGPLASRTMTAIHRGDTLDAYHDEVLASFIPPVSCCHY
jgi:hypothetical protein